MTMLNPGLCPQPLLDAGLARAFESSPLLQHLKLIDDQLRVRAEKAGLLPNKVLKKGPCYQDAFDAQLPCKKDLILIDPQNLFPREFVIYQFGIELLQLLKCQMNAPEIRLCVASCLPENDYQGNAFSNSFFYQKSEETLFILRAYLDCVGSFCLLLLHCIAHITAGSINMDSDPVFLKHFYQGLKVCFCDAFLAKLMTSTALQDTKTSKLICDILLRGGPFSQKRTDLIADLFSVKIQSTKEKESDVKGVRSSADLLAYHQWESWLKGQMAAVKREYFGRPWQEKNIKPQTREELDEEWDNLNQELLEMLKKELQLKAHSTGPSIEETLSKISLEKERLLKKIEQVEARTGKNNF